MRRTTSSLLSLCLFILCFAATARAQLLVGTVPVGARPNSIAVVHGTAGTKMYVANSGDHSVTVIDATTLVAVTIPVGVTTSSDAPQGPYTNLAANEATGKVYVANTDEGTVTVINPDNSTATIDLGGPSTANPFAIAINSITNTVYVADHTYRKLWMIDGANQVSSVSAGSGARSVAVNGATSRVYVANEYDATMTVYDAASHALSTVNVGHSPWKVAVNESTNQVFVSNALDNTLSVLNGANPTNALTFNVGSDPVDIALDTTSGAAYLSAFQGGGITLLSPGQSTISTVATGPGPLALQFNSTSGLLYVLDTGAAELAVVNPANSDVLAVPTGGAPVALAIDVPGQRAYVVNQVDGTLSIFDLTVRLQKTGTSLSVQSPWVLYGGSSKLTAHVFSQAGTPTGSVLFYDATHHAPLATAALGPDGSASYTAQNLTDFQGYSIVAFYQGDTAFAPSHSAPQLVQLIRDSTTTALVAQPAAAFVGDTIKLTAGVSGTGNHPLIGSMSFYELINNRQDLLASVALVNSSASFQTSTFSASSHTLIASYSGDPFNDTSTSQAVTVVLTAGTTSATTTTLSASPNPAAAGSVVQFTASVAGNGAHVPGGTVTFLDGSATLGVVPLGPTASATLSVSSLSTGSHAITASYSGDTYDAPSLSSSLSEVINALISTTSTHIGSSLNPATLGTSVVFTANVSTGSAHAPTGTIVFQDGSAALSTVALNASAIATYTTNSFSVGTHSVTATYAGDSYNSGSVSNAVSQVITSAPNPTPTLSTLTPNAATAGGASFTLSVTGTNFVVGSSVLWNGATRATTYIDANHLTASVAAADIAAAGAASVAVVNPAPGGGVSSAASFTINPASVSSAPSITVLSPAIVKAGSGAFALTVEGTFDTGATVLWAGSPRTTSATSNGLQASIQAEDVVNIGTVDIAIQNPGGAVSPTLKLVIDSKQGALGAFSVASTSSDISLAAGSTATLPVTFTGLNNSASVTVQCVNLPINASCSYSAGTVTLNAANSTPTGSYPVAVIFTATQSISTSGAGKLASFGFIALPLYGVCIFRRKQSLLFMACVSLLLLLTFAGCGGGAQTVKLPISSTPVTATTQSSLAINLTLH